MTAWTKLQILAVTDQLRQQVRFNILNYKTCFVIVFYFTVNQCLGYWIEMAGSGTSSWRHLWSSWHFVQLNNSRIPCGMAYGQKETVEWAWRDKYQHDQYISW